MSVNEAYERLIDEGRKKHAKNAFRGIIALLWSTHTPKEINALLSEQIDYTEDFL